jgi:uncharacterized protein
MDSGLAPRVPRAARGTVGAPRNDDYVDGAIRKCHDRRSQSSRAHQAMSSADTVDPKLLEFLVCPLTKGPLEFDSARQELISRSAKLAYPIRDGIPIMLPEEARKLD